MCQVIPFSAGLSLVPAPREELGGPPLDTNTTHPYLVRTLITLLPPLARSALLPPSFLPPHPAPELLSACHTHLKSLPSHTRLRPPFALFRLSATHFRFLVTHLQTPLFSPKQVFSDNPSRCSSPSPPRPSWPSSPAPSPRLPGSTPSPSL